MRYAFRQLFSYRRLLLLALNLFLFLSASYLKPLQLQAADFSSTDDLMRLIAECQGLIRGGKYDQARRVSEQLTASLWAREEFAVTNFHPVKREAASYGDIDPKTGTNYRAGQPLLFYAEPKHYDFRREAGKYSYAIAIDVEIRSADGKVLDSKKEFVRRAEMHPDPVYSLYTPLELVLNTAPRGAYDVVFTFKDLISNRQTSVTERISIE